MTYIARNMQKKITINTELFGVRVRPVSASEKRRLIDKQLDICVDMNIKSHIVTVDTGANRFDFNFEATFWNQSVVYDHFGSPLLENFLQGFNCTFIWILQISFYEIYNEKLRDLLALNSSDEEDVDGVRHEYTRTSIINFVDLAGSERASYSTRLKETRMINKSLSCLSKVILQLSEKQSYISYRDSFLCRLLKESLGGNAKTFMLATVSPLKAHIEETLSTLRYASHARTIINRAHVNEDPAYTFIKKLKEEIARLHRLLEEGCDKTDESAIAQQHSEQNEQQLQNEESPGDEIVDLVKRMGSLRDTYEQKNRVKLMP
ncbi:unnamed protein product [Soboliphyme baturini]|uniref:Kinesin motor domain-containing protein n=1 Tax=Soboliphyme baturini TaxID=241478 RepID=A0A183IJU7_9BILA|nr:unnamed protein product [Soboliphyme baturini]